MCGRRWGDKRIDGDQSVAARTVFDHHRLAPAGGQPIRDRRAVMSVPLAGRTAG